MKISGFRITLPALRRVLGGKGHESSSFNHCVGGKLYKSHPGSQKAARDAFTEAAKSCKGA